MKRTQFAFVIAVALVAGLAGGVLSNRLLGGRPAYAEEKAKQPKVIEAQEFRVVDENGHVQAALASKGSAAHLVLYEADGEPCLRLFGRGGWGGYGSPGLTMGSEQDMQVRLWLRSIGLDGPGGGPELLLRGRREEIHLDVERTRSPGATHIRVRARGPQEASYIMPGSVLIHTLQGEISFGAESPVGPQISLRDRLRKAGAILGCGSPSLILFDKEGKAAWKAP